MIEMTLGRNDGTAMPSERGVSAILGFILLIGMVASISVGILLFAGDAMEDAEQRSANERVEQSFVELSQQMRAASSNDDVSHPIDLDVGQSGAVVKKDTGHITVTSDALSKDINLTIGTIEYESDDGTKLAYQSGAVFRETGNETQVVSAPPVHYEAETNTLTLPVSAVAGEQKLGSGDVSISHNNTTTFQGANVVQNEDITITVKSDYYRGWESFFRNQAGDTSVQHVDHENRTVEVEVGYIDLENAFDSGVTYSSDIDDFNEEFGDETRKGNLPPMDPVIEELVEDANDDSNNITDLSDVDDESELSGMYYTDELHIGKHESLSADASDGNVTLIVDGNITIEGDLTVDANDDNALRVYLTGDFEMTDNNAKVEPTPSDGAAKAEQLQVYGTSQLDAHFNKGNFHGTFYAASNDWEDPNKLVNSNGGGEGMNDDYQVIFNSNPTFTGALVAHSSNLHADAATFTYDETLEGEDFDAYPQGYELPPDLTYLNVVKHEVEVEQN
ncbi:DUF7289 family protein [Natrinema limicola]|uniref:DUF7305 domain-containing protein n=1 Tax=Natrinema limicola JCM 13563 TaxID=1230457 RepID=M0CHM3_9EURY|nr:hypothetical protein [Natrinema limicola]ELZ21862.1 hypothetical protein C476_07643 [Natrinema limicola JCM 13563]